MRTHAHKLPFPLLEDDLSLYEDAEPTTPGWDARRRSSDYVSDNRWSCFRLASPSLAMPFASYALGQEHL